MDLQLGLFPDADVPRAAAVGPAPQDSATTDLAARLPDGLRLGTSSWSFPGWEGLVFDRAASESVLASEGLGPYAAHPLFGTVGVDRTYYRPMDAAQFRAYADVVPDTFRFLVKADRVLTSPTATDGSSFRGSNPRFLDPSYATEEVVGPMVEGLGAKAGPLLFQFPPIPAALVGGRARFLSLLQRFLEALPQGPIYAIELRTPAFLTDAYARLLDATGAAHAYTVHPAMSPLARQLAVVQPFYQTALVIRWMLGGRQEYEEARDRYRPFDRLVDEDPTTRTLVARTVLDALLGEREAYVIANNKAEGSAPLTVRRLAERITGFVSERP